MFPAAILSTILCSACLYALAQKVIEPPFTNKDWIKPYPPFRIAGNLYYVGTYDLACYLITTPKGHILINTGTAQSAGLIQKSVEALGFKFSDIKILLTNQVHFDHVGAMAAIKKITGAKMMVDKADADVLANGGNSDYLFGGKGCLFAPVKADRILHNLDTVQLGGLNIIVLHHPGHTKGSSSFLFEVRDEQRTYNVLIANMPTILSGSTFPSMHSYPNIQQDFKYTLDTLRKIRFDLWFAPHASQFDLEKKHKPGDSYNPEAFRDQRGFNAALEDLRKEFEKRVKG